MLYPLLVMLMLGAGEPIYAQMSGVTEGPAREFSYEAAEAKGQRKTAPVRTGSEDLILDPSKRSKVQANARDIQRNFAIAAWMIRKHLDYVSSFVFHCRSGDTAFDRDVTSFVERWSRPQNFDAAGRHRLAKFIRLAEARRTIDGDIGVLRLADGRVQGVESDRIRDALGIAGSRTPRWTHGVRLDDAGRAVEYAIHRRKAMGGFQFERTVPAENLHLLGYYERYDQVRGISPLAAGLNSLRDVHEATGYALAKAKVSQLFAMAVTSQALDDFGDVSQVGDDGEESESGNKYEVDFGRGPIKLELDPGDKAEFLESHTPSSEFQVFCQTVITVALKSLDIPFSFYDESHTNFFGSRGAWLHYERGCKPKREDLVELLDWLTTWRLTLAVLDGELTLPSGMTVADVPYEWVPSGMPWWDPAKEIRGDLMAIGAGLDNPQRITKERGRGDWYHNIDRIAEAKKYAEEKGVQVSFDSGAPPVEVVANAE